jgi:anti-anti-sigma factor
MNITVEKIEGILPVIVVTPHGDLDASNYKELIARAQEVYNQGGRYILLDMSDTPFISSSGLVALHTIASMLRGKPIEEAEEGWNAFHAIDRERDSGYQPYVKLLSPQPRVERALHTTGMNQFFQTFTDREAALASFAKTPAP